jgi:8-oxo-dGTP pyrophosphatase MutT (NUDIX family)
MRYTHAGGVVVRVDGGPRHYLLVRAKRSRAWVFPKGHIEAGETLEQAAVREVAEEAGVHAEILARVADTTYRIGRDRANVAYFVVRYTGEFPDGEGRDRRWWSYREARNVIGYDNLREVLDSAERSFR